MANESDLFTTWPTCGAICFRQLLAPTACSATQLACICSHTIYMQDALGCSGQSCSSTDLLQVKALAQRACSIDISTRPRDFVVIVSTLCAVALIMVIIRLVTRTVGVQRLTGWDDCLVVFSWVLAFPLTVTAGFFYRLGIGHDIWTFSQKQLSDFLLIAYIEALFYVVSVGIAKIAVLVFFLRVFPSHRFRTVAFIIIALCIAETLSFTIACALVCLPINYSWLQVYGGPNGKCIAVQTMVVHAALNMALDVAIMVLPMPMLYKLRVNWKKKLQIMFMFSFGLILLAVCIVRMRLFVRNFDTQNPTSDYWELLLWDAVEAYTSIICVCLPVARVFCERSFASLANKVHASCGTFLPSLCQRRSAASDGQPQSISSDKQRVVDMAQKTPMTIPLEPTTSTRISRPDSVQTSG